MTLNEILKNTIEKHKDDAAKGKDRFIYDQKGIKYIRYDIVLEAMTESNVAGHSEGHQQALFEDRKIGE